MARLTLLSCLLGVALFGACTDNVDVADTDTGTASGAAGTGASSSSTAGGPGSGGAPSSGAANGGAGGADNSPRECEQASDCQLIDDCCACEGLPADAQVEECRENCETPSCDALGHLAVAPMCVGGTCVAGFDCYSLVGCFMAEPECPPGEVPVRRYTPVPRGICWGACVPATECAAVTDCSDCDLETQVCVQYISFAASVHCLPKPAACTGPADCACAGAAFCNPDSDQCSGGDGIISCECLDC
jgi:hypothetical protein